MERELRIYEMGETTNPVSLARSRLVHDRFPQEYTATRETHAISLKAVRHSNDDLWSFVMLPDAPPVSRLPPFLYSFATRRLGSGISLLLAEGGRECCTVQPAHTPSPSARARRSGGSRSKRRARRSEGSGSRSAENRGTKNTGCASSRDSPLRRPQSTRRRERERRKKAMGGRPPLRGGSLRPPH
jgi:hypothetical protein